MIDLQGLSFYLFAGIAVAAAFAVIAARNPVHSVLFLILTFFNAAALFVLLGAELLGLLMVVVYVGAVAVLFMFVVMMLDIDYVELREGFLQYLPIGGVIGLILLIELLLVVGGWYIAPETAQVAAAPTPDLSVADNTTALGQLLFTHYVYLFEAAGMILLIAMIGAIVLTHRRRSGVRKQVVADQVARRPEDSIEIRQVEPGQGI